MYDVIIIGAGPGGATAAYFLGEAGKRVLVLEKETLPRFKPCGGGLSLRMLDQVFPFSFEPVIEARVRMATFALGPREIRVPLPERGLATVRRDKFDAHILAQARADVRTGVAVRRVTEQADRVTVETADGAIYEGRISSARTARSRWWLAICACAVGTPRQPPSKPRCPSRRSSWLASAAT
jgi:flavin-dependent dehydrogenase